MVHLSLSLWRFCLLSLPLASSLSIPQKAIVEEYEDTTLIQDLVIDDAELNITDYTSLDEWNPTEWDYDVVIVGGGPAGLAASMSLARVARTSLLYDSQEYRNEQTRYMHDVLGQDGQVPLKFRSTVRQQIEQLYPDYSFWATRKTKVIGIVPLEKGFRVYDDKGGKVTSKRVIMATGIKDVLPDKPGFAEAFGRGMFWCPWCDGHDYKNRKLVVYGKLASAIGSALNMRKLTTDITIVTGGPLSKEDKEAAETRWPGWETVLKNSYKIPIRENDITKVERTTTSMEPKDDQYKVYLNGGGPLDANGIIIHVSTVQTSSLPKQLRLNMDGNGVKVNDNKESSVNGLYVVGDANNDGSTNAYHAMWSAKRAAVHAHVSMSKQEYLDSVPSAMVAVAGGHEDFYRRQMEELESHIGDDVEQMYKALGG
ncbi:hypothetical protein DTO027B5_4113 [Paecilomyces variotii]|nr:hypothetical protein DTO169C6_3438 [Paecilomyces variotii]KAJ9284870.1 hypothetical protein DTO021C3_7503 [Paecilomyces variotii]KAJ9323361.1 hypothetical protein DTO027B3_5711 [Paecilomyces variotii]KAJ9334205.1 hypothetical protein DTO027B5_4113 [Paecilomyces variotii]KAJ9393972.1 hypothetical protein DTO282F9_9108 [Paecilomyces variotii]